MNSVNAKYLILLCGTIITAIVLFYALGPRQYHPASNRLAVLSTCVPSEESPVHYHFFLKITHMGKPYTLPDNIGISEDGCMQPLDTHDGSQGKVHIHYHEPYPFTVGDFFTVWGVIFNKDQFGSTIASERRKITMKVNGKPNYEYDKYVVRNDDLVEIFITPGYTD